ncbi:MAG: response regulator transcription factor, partial [Longicatena sp.]
MYRIMVIEDNDKIRNELSDFLGKNGYQALAPIDFEHILDVVKEEKPDLILLDLNLPVVDGHFICREIRKDSNLPIIVVTSRDSEMDELISMNLGADDFVTKPYNLQILLARISRVLQRAYEHSSGNVLSIHDIQLDISKSTLSYRDKLADLTKNELRIMHCLFENKNKIVSRNELMQHMWDCDLFVDDNTLTVNINRLRKK